jgi:ABC-2 type transport system permease protein
MSGAVKSEFRKFFSTRMWWGMAIAVFLAGGGLAAVVSLLAGKTGTQSGGLPGLDQPGMVNTTYTAGLSFAYLMTLAIGVMAIGSEYRHKTISSTFLAVPQRVRVMLAKVTSLLGVGAFYGLIFCASSVIVGASIIVARGFSAFPASENVPRTLALSLLALGLWALIGLGAGILINNQVAALLISIGIAWIGEFLFILILNAVGWGVATKFLPGQATSAMVAQAASAGGGGGPTLEHLSWWGGALVLVAYAAVLAGIGSLLTVRRDVT